MMTCEPETTYLGLASGKSRSRRIIADYGPRYQDRIITQAAGCRPIPRNTPSVTSK